MDFYQRHMENQEFEHPLRKNDNHKIGVISISGGHRTPKTIWDYFKNGFRQTIGRSYTEISEPNSKKFMDDLRISLRNSRKEHLSMKPIIVETIRHAVSIKIIDKFRQ